MGAARTSAVRNPAAAKGQCVERAHSTQSCWAEVWRRAWAAGGPGAILSPGAGSSRTEKGHNSSPAQAGTGPREIKGQLLVYLKCLKCMANPGTLAVICVPPAWGGALGLRRVTLLWHLPCSACHSSCHCSTAAMHQQAAQVPRARTLGMDIPSSMRRAVPGAVVGQNIPVPAQRQQGWRVCTPSPCVHTTALADQGHCCSVALA